MDWWSIAISIGALIVSISSFQWNKAQHNLNQLQLNANKFCDCLEEFVALGTEHHLTLFKFEIENLYIIENKEKKNLAYNNLQVLFSERKENCQKKHKALLESLHFFQLQGSLNDNELLKWLNSTLNDYFLKLNRFYGDLCDVNFIVRASEKGLLTKERKDFINSFFDNMRDLLDYCVAFTVLKRDIAGYFAKLSLADVGLFGNTQKALTKIEKVLMRGIKEFGFEEAIKEKDYTKIKKHCLDFGDGYDEFVKEERTDFFKFLNAVKYVETKF